MAGVTQSGCRLGSGRCEASEENEVVGHDRGPDISFEVIKAAPGATRQAVGAFEARDAGFDAGAKVAQLAIDHLLLTMASILRPAFLWKAMSRAPHAFAVARLLRVAKPPSAAAFRGAWP